MVSSNIQQPNLSLYTKSFAAVSAFDSFQERTVVVFEPTWWFIKIQLPPIFSIPTPRLRVPTPIRFDQKSFTA